MAIVHLLTFYMILIVHRYDVKQNIDYNSFISKSAMIFNGVKLTCVLGT